ncbi:hypothetical protein NDU88_002600 [Pleurodeles waltl]|uniref:Uncharacterized protein n=1 Tax=Pleurodeles waltl TaxID=8319 RepID=A0AAV7VEA2_PLEWA|nr:hypothetical protein NDU88_002600 [Pleurodeles waltl]
MHAPSLYADNMLFYTIDLHQNLTLGGCGLATGHDGCLKRVLCEAAGLGCGQGCCGVTEPLLMTVGVMPGWRRCFLGASRARDPRETGAVQRRPGTEPRAAASSASRSLALPTAARWT